MTEFPYLRVRVVNVVDLMALFPANDHPHGFSDQKFDGLFATGTDVVFAFHGYPARCTSCCTAGPTRGASTSAGSSNRAPPPHPSTWWCSNRMSRHHLVPEALRRSRRTPEHGTALAEHCYAMLARHHDYVREHPHDMPDVRDWTWTP